ncbi:lantibiotic dehydratase [Galbibacter sp. EGI 63066]|uniref:lantibiotic dehydratase n=1 Tax=Galbibacter sp. EGI 63066 TaxID=2993559 RepID=UPI0022492962|nr:lantibiotic dehydratase [Galbibacter sp. EGI 63066]MCX2682112.1 lantibiotic dehydratase [Galbibacter sp. EGI 63066]
MENKQPPYKTLNKYCLRTSLWPLSRYFELTKNREVKDAVLSKIWENNLIKEAIYLTSPALYKRLNGWLQDKSFLNDKKAQKLRLSLLKYLVRSSVRCTPYGIFSGVSIGELSDFSIIELEPVEKFNKRASLSSIINSRISKAIEKNPVACVKALGLINDNDETLFLFGLKSIDDSLIKKI